MAGSEKEVSDLCMSCGLCCDGTLFPYGFIRDEADKKVADDLGLPVTEISEKLLFKLPCTCFSGKCTVYNKPRSYTCSAFFVLPSRNTVAVSKHSKMRSNRSGFSESIATNW